MPRLDATVGVLGRFASPCFVLGRQRRSAAQRVRLASLAPSGLVWLATRPSTRGKIDPLPAATALDSPSLRRILSRQPKLGRRRGVHDHGEDLAPDKEMTMAEKTAKSERQFPRSITLDNNTSVTLRMMVPADADRIVAFARALPEDDLLFLRSDITDPRIVAQWVDNLAANRTVTVIAETSGELAGYASLHFNQVTWQRHLGEIRIQVASRYRSQGLGRELAGEIFAVARERGLRKIVAQMTADQKGAIATFERLGFQPEALLQDFVIDRSGRTR